jgi:hypothetical protein
LPAPACCRQKLRAGGRRFASTTRSPLVATRTHSSPARTATSLRDSRATVHGGSERFQAVGEAGLRPASLCLIPHRCRRFGLSAEGEGFEPPEGPNGPLRFSRLISFRSTMRPDARCATQRATVRAQRPRAHRSHWDDVGVFAGCSGSIAAGDRAEIARCRRAHFGTSRVLSPATTQRLRLSSRATCGNRVSRRRPSLRASADATTRRG